MYRVLIADDEPIERQVISKKLNGFFKGQIEIFLAANGVEAVEIVKEKHCQIAVLDISMPGKNGLDAAEEIRTFDNKCSIIFLTAFDEFSYAKKAIEVKALDYLLKPGADNELINVMEEAFSIADKYKTEVNNVDTTRKNAVPNGFDLEDKDFSKSGEIVREAKKFIDEHYKEDISLQDVAGVLGYSDVYFCKLFKRYEGISPTQFRRPAL